MKTTRLIFAALLLLLLLLAFASCGWGGSSKHGLDFIANKKSDGSDDGTCYVVWNGDLDPNIVIPSTSPKGLTVTGIGSYAFYGKSGSAAISIPKSVVSIGVGAFGGSTNVTAITVEDGNPVLYSDGNCVIETETKTIVRGCNSSVIPTNGSVTAIGDEAFSGCSTLGTGVDEEGKTIAVPFVIPKSIKTVGHNAFDGCVGLSAVRYTGHLVEWCAIKFDGFLANPQIYAPDFYLDDQTARRTLKIPGNVTEVNDFTFAGCSKLTSVTFPEGFTTIGKGAFYGCTGFTEITLPATVTAVGDHAFRNCSSLTLINFAGTQAQWEGITKGSDWDSGIGDYTVRCSDGDILPE